MMRRRLPLPRNVDDLARDLEQIWWEIPQETIRVPYQSMPRRVAACIQARRGPTLIEVYTFRHAAPPPSLRNTGLGSSRLIRPPKFDLFLSLSSVAALLSLSTPSFITPRTVLLHAPPNIFHSSLKIKSFRTRFSQTLSPTPLVLQGTLHSGPCPSWCHMLLITQRSYKSSCQSDAKKHSYASLLHNSEPSFLKQGHVLNERYRWLTTGVTRIVHLKKESNKRVFSPEEPENTKKGNKLAKKNIKGSTGVHVGFTSLARRSYWKSRHGAGASWHTGTGIVMCQIQHSLFIFRHSYSLLTLCVCPRQSLVQACKVSVTGILPPGVTLVVQPSCGSSIAINGSVCLMHISELSVLVTFHPITTLSAGEMNKEVAEASMQSAALEEVTLKNSSDIIISGDGTWKTRGYSSRVGVCAVIGDKTGKCIDAEVMSSFCKGCDSWKRRKGSPAYKSGKFFTLKNV
ncbi:uncharacterized protein TNCV_2121891 [Trichonephila clavipes]|nr:uncharacterized protein TNCV_2121891 [Trichonephila clavipes]